MLALTANKRLGRFSLEAGLDVRDRSTMVLVGESGSGKTTLLRLIAGLVDPDRGHIEVDGEVWFDSGTTRRLRACEREIGYVAQDYALFPHLTAAENVAFGLRAQRTPAQSTQARVEAALERLGIAALARRRPHELSGGQQQRVALARALVVQPETLLLDEPLSNLDANLREEMRFEVRRLHDAYRYTTVYVTHDQSEAMTTADLIAVMNAGKIEQAGSPEDIYDRPASEFVARFIGSSNVIKGKAQDDAHIDLAGVALRCVGAKLTPDAAGAVSIRPHDIKISTAQPQNAENAVPATVTRQVFLGGSRDYMVEVKDGTQLRVVTAASESIAQGSAVWLILPPEKCRALLG